MKQMRMAETDLLSLSPLSTEDIPEVIDQGLQVGSDLYGCSCLPFGLSLTLLCALENTHNTSLALRPLQVSSAF